MQQRYRADVLVTFARALMTASHMEAEVAGIVGAILVEADLMGHDTHGLQLLPGYLQELENGAMLARGEPTVISDKRAVMVWDGRRLSGVWLTATAVDAASKRAAEYGTGVVAIRNAHHIGCLAAYLERVTARGQMVIITSSDPSVATVAPPGGRDAVFTPDPFAVGIPTDGDPILIDTSGSITTNGMAGRLHEQGRTFPGEWAQDAEGRPTNDPAVLFGEAKGTLLPVGGKDHGHKGYAMALMVESLSQGLSGSGRSTAAAGWGASVFVQVFEPEAFAGLAAFTAETGALVRLCHDSRAIAAPVRLPGERALQRKRAALSDGVELFPTIIDRLAPWAKKLGVPLPAPIG